MFVCNWCNMSCHCINVNTRYIWTLAKACVPARAYYESVALGHWRVQHLIRTKNIYVKLHHNGLHWLTTYSLRRTRSEAQATRFVLWRSRLSNLTRQPRDHNDWDTSWRGEKKKPSACTFRCVWEELKDWSTSHPDKTPPIQVTRTYSTSWACGPGCKRRAFVWMKN